MATSGPIAGDISVDKDEKSTLNMLDQELSLTGGRVAEASFVAAARHER
jgi:hypothetical protein